MSTQQILSLESIGKSIGDKNVLRDVSLSLNRLDRFGLVGENGAGKTTLAQIILGILEPDSGTRRFSPNAQVGYLPQEVRAEGSETLTLQVFLEQALGGLDWLRREMEILELLLADQQAGAATAKTLQRYGNLQNEFAARGGYDVEFRFDQVLTGLGLASLDRPRTMQSLSGGEKTRAGLASLLLGEPDILILDEPTNHLDFSAVEWLENYLATYPGAVLAISHDRRFLNRVVNQIGELSWRDHTLTVFPGNYDDYIAAREQILAQQAERKALKQTLNHRQNPRRPTPMKDHNKMAYDAAGERSEQTRRRALRNAQLRVDTLEDDMIDKPAHRWQINPDFDPKTLVSREVIRLENVSKRYGANVLFSDLNATIVAGDRIIIYGPNGMGKTTLLRMITGLEIPDSGRLYIASGVRIGYLDQVQETLASNSTVLETFRNGLENLSEAQLRSALHKYGLFSEDQVFQPIRSLSIGQRRKLQIARLVATQANVLVLDEPTNHLDLDSVLRFEDALAIFQGTIVAVSHDRYFIDRMATRRWTFCDGVLIES